MRGSLGRMKEVKVPLENDRVLDALCVACVVMLAAFPFVTAGSWLISKPSLDYSAKAYSISMIGDPAPSTVPNGTTVTFTITLLFGTSAVFNATVYLYNFDVEVASGSTDSLGTCVLNYTLAYATDYSFTARYLTP
jgi:hypothetical protein